MNQVQLVQQLRQLCASGISSWARQGALMALMSRNLNGEIPAYVFFLVSPSRSCFMDVS